MLQFDQPPPPLQASRWFNTPDPPPTLETLRGRVVAVHSFQMLCPGCVVTAMPQMARLREAVSEDKLALIGLHTVFEHHAAMQPPALEVFLHEWRVRYPVAVDAPDPAGGALPRTMAAWGLQGTPSLVLIDRTGRVQLSHFGRIDDIVLGALVGQLIAG